MHEYPNWYTSEIIKLVKEKARFRKKIRNNGSIVFETELKRLRTVIKWKTNDAFAEYLIKEQEDLKNDQSFSR